MLTASETLLAGACFGATKKWQCQKFWGGDFRPPAQNVWGSPSKGGLHGVRPPEAATKINSTVTFFFLTNNTSGFVILDLLAGVSGGGSYLSELQTHI